MDKVQGIVRTVLSPVNREAVLIALVVASACATFPDQADSRMIPGCGIRTLMALCEVLDRPQCKELETCARRNSEEKGISMLEIQQLGRLVGIKLTGVSAKFDELAAADQPCIVHLFLVRRNSFSP